MSVVDTGATPGTRLDRALEKLRAEGRVGLMTHIVFGYPSAEESRAIVERMARSGADAIEVQIPFSDPTADGPVITEACQRALDGGVRVADALAFMKESSERYDIPFLFMNYLNTAFSFRGGESAGGGLRVFVEEAARAGASGLIVPDLPPEQRQEGYPDACREFGIHPVYVVSPNTPERRLEAIGEVASGLVYVTSRTGTTGREMELALTRLEGFLGQARAILELPLAVGFSISRREHVEALRGHADLAVVGTHFIRAYQAAGLDGLETELRQIAGRQG